MLAWSVFVLFLVALGALLCIVVLLKPDKYFTRKHLIVCPETHLLTAIDIDVSQRVKTLLRGTGKLEIADCKGWPERRDCDEECLLQVDLKPKVLERTLRKWYADKNCGMCGNALTENDWRLGRFSGVDEHGQFVPGSELPLRTLAEQVVNYRPVCWTCHQRRRAERGVPQVLFKDDRRGHREEPLFEG